MTRSLLPAALVVRAPARRILMRLGSFLLIPLLAEAALVLPVLKGLARATVLLAPPGVALLLTVVFLVIWPTSIRVTPTEVVVGRIVRSRRFDRAAIAVSVDAPRLEGALWREFRLLALADRDNRPLLRVDDKLFTPDDLNTLASILSALEHVRHDRADTVSEIVERWPFAGTILHRHYYLTRIVGVLVLVAFTLVSVKR